MNIISFSFSIILHLDASIVIFVASIYTQTKLKVSHKMNMFDRTYMFTFIEIFQMIKLCFTYQLDHLGLRTQLSDPACIIRTRIVVDLWKCFFTKHFSLCEILYIKQYNLFMQVDQLISYNIVFDLVKEPAPFGKATFSINLDHGGASKNLLHLVTCYRRVFDRVILFCFVFGVVCIYLASRQLVLCTP